MSSVMLDDKPIPAFAFSLALALVGLASRALVSQSLWLTQFHMVMDGSLGTMLGTVVISTLYLSLGFSALGIKLRTRSDAADSDANGNPPSVAISTANDQEPVQVGQ